MKRDQRQRGRISVVPSPWGCRVGEAGELVPIPEQHAAIRRMRKLRGKRLVSAAAGHGLTSTGLPFRRRSADRTARGYL